MIFMVIIEPGEGVVERDAGHLPARKVTARSRRGGGRCGTMRWGSHGYKIGINESTRLSSGAFSISIMNLEAHRPATDEANETLAACEVHDRRGGVTSLASRADVERSHGESDVRHEVFFGLENNLSSSCHGRDELDLVCQRCD